MTQELLLLLWGSAGVMVNFICQRDQATGRPNVQSKGILSVSVRQFPDKSNTPGLSEAGACPSVGGAHPVPRQPEETGGEGCTVSLPDLSWDMCLLPSDLLVPGLWIPTELFRQLSWVSSLQTEAHGASQPL